MNNDIIKHIEKTLQEIITSYYANNSINIFDKFIDICQQYYDGPAHSIAEIKLKQNTKLKGDIFEHFAHKYLQHAYKTTFTNIWLLKDTPEEVLTKLKLKRHDLGIDLLAVDSSDKYYAIQAKYRKKGYKSVHGISWRQLSTFYALVNRTGPYERCIVITNADFVRHIGKKTKQDQSICHGTLSKLPMDSWIKMANIPGQTLGNVLDTNAPTKTTDETISTDTLETCASTTVLEDKPKKIIIIRKKETTPLSDIELIRKKRLEYLGSG